MTQKAVFLEGIFTLRNLRSAGAAAIIEILIALGIAGLLIWQRLQPAVTPPVPPTPVHFPDTPLPLPRNIPAVPQPPQAEPLAPVPAVPWPITTPTSVPVQPLAPPMPAQHAQAPADLAAEFGSRMLQAINERKVYPKAALLRGETGETVVSFDYVNGTASDIHVDRSSGFRDLDEAAVRAVEQAGLPAKPAALSDLKHFVFHLEFNLGG